MKNIPGYAHDMLFDQGLVMDEKDDAVGREQVFQFQSVHARGIGPFDVKMVVIVVEPVDDTDPKRLGVAEGTMIYPGDSQVLEHVNFARGLQQGVDVFERLVNFRLFLLAEVHGFPEGVVPLLVEKGNGHLVPQQIFIVNRKVYPHAIVCQVLPELLTDRVRRLFVAGDIAG